MKKRKNIRKEGEREYKNCNGTRVSSIQCVDGTVDQYTFHIYKAVKIFFLLNIHEESCFKFGICPHLLLDTYKANMRFATVKRNLCFEEMFFNIDETKTSSKAIFGFKSIYKFS